MHPENDLEEVVTHVQINYNLAYAHPITKALMIDGFREMRNMTFLSAYVFEDGQQILSDLARMAPAMSNSLKILKLKQRKKTFYEVCHRCTKIYIRFLT